MPSCNLKNVAGSVYVCRHRGCDRLIRIERASPKTFRTLTCRGEPDTDDISADALEHAHKLSGMPIWSQVAGPGTALRKLFAELGVVGKGCNCPATAAKMDQAGPTWCRANIDELCTEIRANASKWGLGKNIVKLIAVGVKAMTMGIDFDPLHPIKSLVLEAIRRAEVDDATRQLTGS